MYSAASAVLLNELLKGAISLSIAFRNAVHHHHGGGGGYEPLATKDEFDGELAGRNKRDEYSDVWNSTRVQLAAKKLFGEIFRSVSLSSSSSSSSNGSFLELIFSNSHSQQ